jgi:cytochrome c-type biogenesis protein CcmF
MVTAALVLACWSMAASVHNVLAWSKAKGGLRAVPRAIHGMNLAHFGLGVFVIGVSLASGYSIERDVRLAPGESASLGRYSFRFEGVTPRQGPNYESQVGRLEVSRGGDPVASIETEKRSYMAQGNVMTDAGIDASLSRDLYVALGEPLGDGAWSLRLYFKPFVRCIWLGGFLMALGGLLAASDRRYRLRVAAERRADASLARDARPA